MSQKFPPFLKLMPEANFSRTTHGNYGHVQESIFPVQPVTLTRPVVLISSPQFIVGRKIVTEQGPLSCELLMILASETSTFKDLLSSLP